MKVQIKKIGKSVGKELWKIFIILYMFVMSISAWAWWLEHLGVDMNAPATWKEVIGLLVCLIISFSVWFNSDCYISEKKALANDRKYYQDKLHELTHDYKRTESAISRYELEED